MSHWMNLALQEAESAAALDEVPVGAVVVFEGKIVGVGHNLRETRQSPSAHAEVIALEAAARELGSWRLIDCELYVTLEPCPMCLGACQQARVRRVIYGAVDAKGGALSHGYALHQDSRFNHRFDVSYAPDDRCEAILKEFFRKKRAQKKASSE